MSEKTVENGTVDASKPIIITKSIKSLTEPAAPLVVSNQENVNTEANDQKLVISGKELTPEEKLKLRAKKFGIQSENAKLTNRAERFGLSASGGAVADDSKLNKRAERFGIAAAAASATASPVATSDLLEKRSKRFGIEAETKSEPSEALLKRKERFGTVNEDDKKKLRSQRFEGKV